MKSLSGAIMESSVAPLLQAADYLSRPQQFLAVAEARAEFRETLKKAAKHSIVLTNNGEPQAAIVPFETLEAMRGALLQLLLSEIQGSFGRMQHQITAESAQQAEDGKQPEPTSEEELESLVREARVRQVKPDAGRKRKKRR
jgi:prevent-host-death family protein